MVVRPRASHLKALEEELLNLWSDRAPGVGLNCVQALYAELVMEFIVCQKTANASCHLADITWLA